MRSQFPTFEPPKIRPRIGVAIGAAVVAASLILLLAHTADRTPVGALPSAAVGFVGGLVIVARRLVVWSPRLDVLVQACGLLLAASIHVSGEGKLNGFVLTSLAIVGVPILAAPMFAAAGGSCGEVSVLVPYATAVAAGSGLQAPGSIGIIAALGLLAANSNRPPSAHTSRRPGWVVARRELPVLSRGRLWDRANPTERAPHYRSPVITDPIAADPLLEQAEPSATDVATDRVQDANDKPPFYPVFGDEPRLAEDAVPRLPPVRFPYVPSRTFDGFRLGPLDVRAASHIGTAHAFGAPVGVRQDDYAVAASRDGKYMIAALADGVGNARMSHVGAFLGTRIAASVVAERLTEQPLEALEVAEIISRTSSLLERVALRFIGKVAPADLSTTLVLTVVPVDQPVALFLRVGDSSAWLRTATWFEPLFDEVERVGGVADVSTTALPFGGDPQARLVAFPPGSMSLLATDGVAEPMLLGQATLGRAFHTFTAHPPSAGDFMRLIGFRRLGAHDDRGAIAIWRAHPS